MLRALTIEYLLVALFVMGVLRYVAPTMETPAIGWALMSVFTILVIVDVARTLHEESVIRDVLEDLDEE